MPSSPAFLNYMINTDVLVLSLFEGDDFPVPMQLTTYRNPANGQQIDVHTGRDDGRIYVIALHEAFTQVTADVILSGDGRGMPVHPDNGGDGRWLVVLSPAVALLAASRAPLVGEAGPSALQVLLSREGHAVGFEVADGERRLPAAVVAAEAQGG